jgi:hypothetical protein
MWRLAILTAALLIGCGSPTSPPPPTPTGVVPSQAADAAISALVASMAAAVRAGDRAGYLALVDLSDPVFALEHGRWADDWSGPNPPRSYSLQVADIAIEEPAATARLTVTWMGQADEGPRTATFAVRFANGARGWRYAGEDWVTTQAAHVRIQVAPGLEDEVPEIVADFPAIYDHVTATLGYEPGAALQIKLYADAPALVANTLLSLPDIRGWNEPGEALKLQVGDGDPPLSPVIAHELTHFLGFDRAGTHRSRMPWWLDEGLASFAGAHFEGAQAPDRLAQVIEWQAAGELAPWDAMAVFEEAPRELWRFVYPQGYAMVRYVTERYGEAVRNDWLAAMATEMDIDGATPSVLGLSFDALDAAFREWLSAL